MPGLTQIERSGLQHVVPLGHVASPHFSGGAAGTHIATPFFTTHALGARQSTAAHGFTSATQIPPQSAPPLFGSQPSFGSSTQR